MPSLSITNRLKELQGQAAHDVRRGWHHYTCLFCDDKSHHLGINWDTGRYRCLRCGARGSLSVTRRGGTVMQKTIDPHSGLSAMYTHQGDTTLYSDNGVLNYAVSRGLRNLNLGWAFGRKDIAGNIVFPTVDMRDRTNYLQYRGSQTRWRSWGSNEPRLDHWQLLQKNSPLKSVLVLAEGPVDALMVRKFTGLWSAPTFGIDAGRNKKFIRDIAKRDELRRILVWYDAEPRAEVKSNSLARKLKMETGIEVIPVYWPSYTNEDQGASSKDRITDIIGDYI